MCSRHAEGHRDLQINGKSMEVMETLTPQGFLAFRDDLGTASGFESYQMRELEIILGLTKSMRGTNFDPLEQFRKTQSETQHRHTLWIV